MIRAVVLLAGGAALGFAGVVAGFVRAGHNEEKDRKAQAAGGPDLDHG